MRSSAFVTFLVLGSSAFAQTTTRVDVTSLGFQSNLDSSSAAVSGDGRFVAFHSTASILGTNDGNAKQDVFVHDRFDGSTIRVSLSTTGGDPNQDSSFPDISADGRYVLFESRATNLTPTDTTGVIPDLYVRDLFLGTTEIVSLDADGLQPPATPFSASVSGAMSADGRFVVFVSEYGGVTSGDSNNEADVFLRDRLLATTTLVSATPSGTSGNGPSRLTRACLSDDGRFVVFESLANDLVPGDSGSSTNVFLRDVQLGTTVRFDTYANGVPVPGVTGGRWAAISADGSTGFFVSTDANLVPGDANGFSDLFAKDLATGALERLNVNPDGNALGAYFGYGYDVSTDGRRVVMSINGSEMGGGFDTARHVFLRDRDAVTTEQVDVATNGTGANAETWVESASISGDGRVVGFSSRASNLVAGDTNGIPFAATIDVFARDFDVLQPTTAYCTAKVNSQGCTPVIGASGIASLTDQDSLRVTAHRVLNKKAGLLFWSTAPVGTPYFGGTLCCKPPVKRTTLQDSGGSPTGLDCSGLYSFHFSQSYMTSQSLAAGVTVRAQYWSRDSGFAAPNNMGLTDALAITIAP